MHYLVTGAAGFIGSHLTRCLVQSGAAVSAIVKFDDDRLRLRDVLEQVDLHEADLRTAGVVTRALDQIEPAVIFHCAAAGVSDPFLPHDEAIRSNVYGTINLLRAARGRARVIVLRTPGEIDALNVYAASKAAAWQFCRMYRRTQGWPIVGAMVFQVYGPGQSQKNVIPAAIEAALADRDFPMTAGRSRRDWIYIDDVVEALIALASAEWPDTDSFEIGTGRLTRVGDVVEMLYTLIGRSGKPLLGVLPDLPGEVEAQGADVKAAQAVLNWEAQVSLADGLRRTIDWMKHERRVG